MNIDLHIKIINIFGIFNLETIIHQAMLSIAL